MVEFDDIKVKDQLGKPDEFAIFGPFRKSENILQEEQPTVVAKTDISQSAIWDNGNWDSVDWDQVPDGFILNNSGRGVLGLSKLGTPDDTPSILETFNYNDTFVWRFREQTNSQISQYGTFYTFGFTDLSNTTASEDAITNFRVDFTDGEIWTSKPIFLTQDTGVTVTSISIETTETGDLSWEATANGGSNWEIIAVGETHLFSNQGRDVRLRATSTGVSTLSLIKARYEK